MFVTDFYYCSPLKTIQGLNQTVLLENCYIQIHTNARCLQGRQLCAMRKMRSLVLLLSVGINCSGFCESIVNTEASCTSCS